MRLTDGRDQVELGLEPIQMLLLAHEDVFDELAGAVVADLGAKRDALVEARDRIDLELTVELQLLRDGLADVDLVEALQVGNAVKIEDALDEIVGVLHLLDRFFANARVEPEVTPVLTHLGVDEV